MPIHLLTRIAFFSILLCGLAACTTPRQQPLPIGSSLVLGVAHYSQPRTPSDLLAGYVPENLPTIDQKVLSELDALLAETLSKQSKQTFVSREVAAECQRSYRKEQDTSRQSALRSWAAVGRCMQVDYLIVPQIIEWRERDGGELGVATPAGVIMDTFIVDVHNESLVSRSRYDETQAALTSNLLQANRFFQRGGKWVQAHTLAREGMEKAIKELGL